MNGSDGVNQAGASTAKSGKRRIALLSILVVALALGGYALYQRRVIQDREGEIVVLREQGVRSHEEQSRLNEYIGEITGQVSDIGARLRLVRERQVTISTLVPVAETDSSVKTTILNDIVAIESQLDSDRRIIGELVRKMKSSSVRITSLERMVESLQREIEESQNTIDTLTRTIHAKDEEIATTRADLQTTQGSLKETEQRLTDTRNAAYYVIGKPKELQEKGVIDRFGVFRKRNALAAEFDPADFTKVDKTRVTEFEIPAGRKDIKLVPERTPGSYSLQEIDKTRSLLKVLDPAEFWKVAYLVVVMD